MGNIFEHFGGEPVQADEPEQPTTSCDQSLSHEVINEWTESMINQQQPERETPFRTLTNEGNDV